MNGALGFGSVSARAARAHGSITLACARQPHAVARPGRRGCSVHARRPQLEAERSGQSVWQAPPPPPPPPPPPQGSFYANESARTDAQDGRVLTATIVGAVVVAACIGFAQPQALRLPWQQQPSRVLTKEEQRAQYLAALEEASSVSDYDRSAVRARTAPSLADGDRGALGAGLDDPQRRAAREAAAARRPPFTGSTVSERGPRGLQGDWAHPWQYDGNGQLFVLISDTWMRVHREPGTTRSVIVTDKSDGAKQHYRMRVPKGWPLEEIDLTDQKTVGLLFGSNENVESSLEKIKARQ